VSGSAPREPAERARLVFFYGRQDGFSRRVEGYLAQVLQRRQNQRTFVFHPVEVVQRPDLAERFQVEEVPTLLVIDGRRVRARLVKPQGAKPIKELLAPWLR
jgi:thioredoxin-like negative regulator of GroEL